MMKIRHIRRIRITELHRKGNDEYPLNVIANDLFSQNVMINDINESCVRY